MTESEEKLGVFICTGYGLAEALDIDALCAVATDEFKVPFCRTVDSCEGPGLAAINDDIREEGLTRVVVAGISPRRYADNAFPDDVIVEKIGLREQVIWVLPPGDEDTQMAAEDYLRMYITKAREMQLAVPFQPETELDRSILVVGGGIAGLTAANEAADAGYAVRLVEKSDRLGGWLAKQHRSFPTKPPWRDLEETGIDELISTVENHPGITIHTSACTSEIVGAPGLFDVTLTSSGNGKPEGETVDTFRVGSIIQATGWMPNDPRKNLSWGNLDDVILNVDLEAIVKEEGKITRPSDGKEVKSIAFLQCGGCTGTEPPTYCSSICCMTSLKQAMYLREGDEDAKAFIFYEFMRTPGLYEEFYRKAQDDPGIFLTRGEIADVTRNGSGEFTITARDTMLGEQIEVNVDLVVLAAGMVPNAADGESIRALGDARITMTEGDSEQKREEAVETVEQLKHHEGTEILNLSYRQGPDLPALEYGFPDSHFICFPYESRRTGIYPTGAVREPNDASGSIDDATGAALKAIQCIEMTSRGEAVHPRAGDRSYPEFQMSRCTKCKRCTEECPFGMLNEDVEGTPLLQETRCRRCGICLGACPERIISFKDYSIHIIGSMIKAVHVPEEWDEKPRVLVLACENDAFPALDLMGQKRMNGSPWMRVVPLRCLGSMNNVWITDAMSAGYDGVILLGCKYGDDYQCHFIKGSELASVRQKNAREKLEQMAMDLERVELHELSIDEYGRLPEIFEKFGELIEEIGYNPFKGM
ncbi:hydrogenase iron-sulfur subunit [Candidatus Zixiibacteriota bacterium]